MKVDFFRAVATVVEFPVELVILKMFFSPILTIFFMIVVVLTVLDFVLGIFIVVVGSEF